jgi:hypothetical protein
MRVLVACESSGIVRDAFIKQGHEATSCDLLPCETGGNHHQGNVLDILDRGWDLMIAHPPCTYLCASGFHWNYRQVGRHLMTLHALQFVQKLLRAPIRKIAIENPNGCISSEIAPSTQIIQPYEFGENASKATALWLIGLPLLVSQVARYQGRWVEHEGVMVERWDNQTDSGQNKLSPGADRWKERSRTYQGIADAMAYQWAWGSLL